jgi:hypothetical protein
VQRPKRLTAEQQREIWERLSRGERSYTIGPAVGCHEFTVRELAARSGGIRPRERTRDLGVGLSARKVARGRCVDPLTPQTVSRTPCRDSQLVNPIPSRSV